MSGFVLKLLRQRFNWNPCHRQMKLQTTCPCLAHLALWLLMSLARPGIAPAGEVPVTNTSSTNRDTLTDGEIRTMLRDYIATDKLGVGLVVGIVDEHGSRVVSYGKLDNGTNANVNGNTLFPIGSVTKVLTALLLQDMVDRGEMKLDEPVQKYLPKSVKMPRYHGKQITLLDLATHTSGLPRDCDGSLYASLSHCTLRYAPGTHWEYSNLGFGLLGHVITLKAGKDYESLVIERICQPLGMNDTCVTLTPGLKARLASGHATPGYRVRDFSSLNHDTNAQVPNLLGAGSLRSTANDLLKFVAAYAGISRSPLNALMQKAQALHALQSGAKRRLAWDGDGPVFEHGGLLDGYQAELAFDVKRHRGVVVLSNCSSYGTFVPGVWRALLEGCSPKPANVAQVSPALYDDYTGLYKFGKGGELCSARREGNRLLLQVLGKPGQRLHYFSCEVFPQSESVFCNKFWQVQARFIPAADGQPLRLVLTSLGPNAGWSGSAESVRISKEIPPVPTPVHIDSSVYKNYVGQYRETFLFGLIHVGPTLNISYSEDDWGDHFIAHVRGLGSEEIFPTSQTSFIPGPTAADDVRLTFIRNNDGQAKGVLVYWNGKRIHGRRISKEP
jgi:CubicO group peptidase (beta-lactamase class C family)